MYVNDLQKSFKWVDISMLNSGKKIGLLHPWEESTPILYIPARGMGYHSHFSDEYYEAFSVIISSLYNKLRLEQIYPLRHVAYAAFGYSAFSCFFGQLKLGGIYHSICLKSKSLCDEGCGDGLSRSVLKSKYSRYEMIIPKQQELNVNQCYYSEMSGYVILKAPNEETKEFYLESFKFHK